jgi:2-C-methyl-D-erythritol 2,4-cyclodiphosphate synthase
MFKTGIGYDVHKLKKDLPLFIGGIDIKSPLGSIGHSDGDALIHAIVDSLLGATGLGDIGNFFPSNDKKWKNVQSQIFLTETNKKISQIGYQISNIDCTIILQKPKLQKHIPIIRKNISNILSLSTEKISVKATTTDYLGFIGKSKGWSVIAVSTIHSVDEYPRN